jgi:hypothetical protein
MGSNRPLRSSGNHKETYAVYLMWYVTLPAFRFLSSYAPAQKALWIRSIPCRVGKLDVGQKPVCVTMNLF